MAEHAVIVRFTYAEDALAPLLALERQLQRVIDSGRLGDFDGHEITGDLREGVLWMYGPDGDALFQAVRPLIAGATCFSRAVATLRFGLPSQAAPQRIEVLREPANEPTTVRPPRVRPTAPDPADSRTDHTTPPRLTCS